MEESADFGARSVDIVPACRHGELRLRSVKVLKTVAEDSIKMAELLSEQRRRDDVLQRCGVRRSAGDSVSDC